MLLFFFVFMSQKHLSRVLSKLEDFNNPKLFLEQYKTNSDVAAEILWSLDMKGFVKNRVVVDLGAGTGVLGIGALLLGASKVVFLEKDESAIDLLKNNLNKVEEEFVLGDYEIIKGDVSSVLGSFDLVLMNPPFGTKTKRMDTVFLEKAFSLSDNILTIHKSSTKDYIFNLFRDNDFEVVDLFDFDYVLKKTYDHQSALSKKIEVSAFFARKK